MSATCQDRQGNKAPVMDIETSNQILLLELKK